jgi:hypothetical protein
MPEFRAEAESTFACCEIWCQREIRTLKTPVSKTRCYSNSHTVALWYTGKDLNLRVPLGKTGLQPVRFGRAHAPVQTSRKVSLVQLSVLLWQKQCGCRPVRFGDYP